MKPRYLTAKQLDRLLTELRAHDGEAAVAGWYFQTSDEDAPIGPYNSREECAAAIQEAA